MTEFWSTSSNPLFYKRDDKVILSETCLDNMIVLRWRLKEFRVTRKYFNENMIGHALNVDKYGVFGLDNIVVRLYSGKEIPVVIDESVNGYSIVYNMS